MSDSWKVGRINVRVGGLTSAAPQAPPEDPTRARLREIQAAAQAGDLDRAGSLALSAVQAGVQHPMALNLAALALEKAERFEDALGLLRRAVELAPQEAAAHNALGLCLHRLERHAEALAAFDAALALQPDFPGALCARGAALEAAGRLVEAQAAYDRVLRLQPENLAAVAGLANLASRRGDHAAARPLAERVLAAAPHYPDAVMALAAADLAEGAAERAGKRLEMLVADDRLTLQQKALALGLSGDVLDAQGRAAEAFEAYTACNMTLWRAYQPAHGGESALDFAREMLRVIERLPDDAWAAEAAPAAEVKGHVFLTGFPRSGTTLLEQVLASHPEVVALEERETLADAQRAFLSRPSDLERLARAGEADLDPLREAYWARVRAEGADPTGKVFVDKHPLNTFRLPLILKLFPDARILFARRDPRDVVLSAFRRRFAMSGSAYQLLTLTGCAGYYDAAMRMAQALTPALGDRLHVVVHERLVEGFDAEAKAACEALGLPWNQAMRDFAGRVAERGVATPSGAQLARGLSAEGMGAWRRYADQLEPVRPTLARWVEAYGYPAD